MSKPPKTIGRRRYRFEEPTTPAPPPRRADWKTRGWVYRVAWKRDTLRPKYKHFHTLRAAVKWFRNLGPAPWRYWSWCGDPDDQWDCRKGCGGTGKVKAFTYDDDGNQTEGVEDCPLCYGGVSVREFIRRRREDLPRLLWVRIERRPVGAWEEVEVEWQEDPEAVSTPAGGTSPPRTYAEGLSPGLSPPSQLTPEELGAEFERWLENPETSPWVGERPLPRLEKRTEFDDDEGPL